MAESSLSLGYADFCAEVGFYLGYGRDTIAAPTKWTADQIVQIDAVVQAGYRQFLAPPGGHKWRFLTPTTTLSLTANDYDVDLPDDFASLENEFSFAVTDYQTGPILIVAEGRIRRLREGGTSTGAPQFVAVRPKTATAGTVGQRWEVIFWPTPDGSYTLSYGYNALVSHLTTALPYPLGGMNHGETILAFCLAVAEERMNDERGIRWQTAMDRLAVSISADCALEALYHGYNADHSDDGRAEPLPAAVTYNSGGIG